MFTIIFTIIALITFILMLPFYGFNSAFGKMLLLVLVGICLDLLMYAMLGGVFIIFH